MSRDRRIALNSDGMRERLEFHMEYSRNIHSVRMDNSTFERVEEFKYLGTNLTNQNVIQEEIKSRLRSGNA